MNWFKIIATHFIPDLTPSFLYNEHTFYQKFIKDLLAAKKEIIIESPYITRKRMDVLFPIFTRVARKGVAIYIITRNPREHEGDMVLQAEREVRACRDLGINVLFSKGNHHRKIAIIDRKILWEGSLNILSQSYSREIMRRIENKHMAKELFAFLGFNNIRCMRYN